MVPKRWTERQRESERDQEKTGKNIKRLIDFKASAHDYCKHRNFTISFEMCNINKYTIQTIAAFP